MTQDEIIEMANEAGIIHPQMVITHLEAFARLVVAKYEQKIQDLEDMITELQERQE